MVLLQLLGKGGLGVGVAWGEVFKHGRAHFKAIEPRLDDDLAKQPHQRGVVERVFAFGAFHQDATQQVVAAQAHA